MEMKTRLFGLLVVFVSLGFTSSVLAGSTRVTKDGIQFPDGTTQTTSSTGGYGRWSADGFNVYYNSGNVGIGTTSPQNKLHIAGNFPQLLIQSDASGNLGYEGLFLGQTESGTFSLTGWIGDTDNLSRGLVVGADSTYPLILYQNGEARMTINNGKVGIGTPEPESKLDIQGATNDLVLSRLNQIGNKNWCGWRFDRNTSEKWFIGMGKDNDNLQFRRTASRIDMVIEESGQVGISTDDPKYNLEVNGTAGKPHGGTWADSSDERLKTNINELNSKEALDKIAQLRGVNFEWINAEEHAEGLRSGILAQELEVIFPDWVEEVEPTGRDKGLIPQGEKAKAISFPHDFNAYLIEAIKELKVQNEKQQAEIEELRALIKELKS